MERITKQQQRPISAATQQRLCPACVRRPEFLVADSCILCSGAGVLVLGRLCQGAAIGGRFPPAVVSRAVEFAVDLVAEQSMAAGLDRAAGEPRSWTWSPSCAAEVCSRPRQRAELLQFRSGPGGSRRPIDVEAIAEEPAPVPDQCVEVSPSVPGFPWGAWLLVA